MTLCGRYDEEWELLLLGTLDVELSEAMRAHVLSGCARCAERWAEAARLLSAVGATTESVDPPLRVEQRLRQRLTEASAETARNPVIRSGRRAGTFWQAAGAAAALVALAAAAWLGWRNADLRRRLAEAERRLEASSVVPLPAASPTPAPVPSPGPGGAEPARWERERARLEDARRHAEAARAAAEEETARLAAAQQAAAASAAAALDALQQRAEERERAVEQLTARLRRVEAEALRRAGEAREHAAAMRIALDERSTRVVLRAVDPLAGQATASATLSPDGRLLLMARGLPPLPSDKCYQLWVIRRDDPAIVSAGVVSVGGEGQAFYATRVEGAERVTGFALTDEPLGGSVAARGRKLLFGSVQQR